MAKTNSQLKQFCDYLKSMYGSFSTPLNVIATKYKGTDLGYCYKYTNPEGTYSAYNVFCFETGDEDLDLRVKSHEFGHIQCAHLDGLHQELDNRIMTTIKTYRAEMVDLINKECGIDYGSDLIDKVLNDRTINQELHNVAMDMEVNSTILDIDDIDSMEKIYTDVLTAQQARPGMTEEQIQQIRNRNVVKFIHPSRYHLVDPATGTEVPFPEGRSYAEYLIMIVKHLDQFIKMLVSLSQGGNGDTSNISSQNVADALNSMGNGEGDGDSQDGQGQGQGQGGGNGGDNLSDLNERVFGSRKGEAETTEQAEQRRQASGDSGDQQGDATGSGSGCDHGSESRDKANVDRANGTPGKGIGNSADASLRQVQKNLDPVSMALNEVIRNFRKTVVKWTSSRDLMKNYNRGIIRNVVAPSMMNKFSVHKECKIVYLIDISGSMNNQLIDRCLGVIKREMRKIDGGLKYDIITCNTDVRDHYKDIDPKRSIPRIHSGGGTSIARGIKYFRQNYSKDAALVIISDFEDYMQEWKDEESKMKGYQIYGFNYGRKSGIEWSYLKERHFPGY